MSFKKFGFIAAALSLVATSIFTLGAQAAPEPKSVYIVKFVDNASVGNEVAAAKRNGIDVTNVLEFAFKGFIGEMTRAQAAALARNPRVEIIEQDSEVLAFGEQSQATWGIDRIDQEKLPLNSTYIYGNDGTGVTAYVIDTGILSTHTEFSGGRVKSGYTAINDRRGTSDCNGHGTHVAGTIGGSTYGVAQNVNLVPVRVLDCRGSGSNSGVIAGMDWILSPSNKNPITKAVVNMSLGGGVSGAVDNAVAKLVSAGVVVVVAAGNSSADACNSSPARAASAITVGATTSSDAIAGYSNFGDCVDLFAPGSSITSAWINSKTKINTNTNTISGTSMASPHVAGVVARYLGADGNPSLAASALTSASAKQVKISVLNQADKPLLYWSPSS